MTTELELRRTLAAPPEAVWQALTEPGALAAWFWPDRFGTKVEVDLRVGGRYRINGPGAGMAAAGEYVAVDEPTRLVFTWRWDGELDETLVTYTLTSLGEATELVVLHERFADDDVRDRHAQGWSDCLDRLPGWLAPAA